ncbi:MAG: dTMP kinase [Lachnospiraceae bacterium]|nr:dTMP kinase [Lachnospiraceae bacterium]
MKRGLFITLEGIDGSGKSTQVNLLKNNINKANHACYTTVEPSDGPLGAMLRTVLSGRVKMDESAMAALFAADRLDHITNDVNGIRDKVIKGTTVVCDRYLLSSYAYQSVRSPLDWVIDLNRQAKTLLPVDLTIFIDVTPEVAIKRITANRSSRDLFESKEMLTAVRDKYLELIEELGEEENIIIVNGDQSVEDLSDEIWEKVSQLYDKN